MKLSMFALIVFALQSQPIVVMAEPLATRPTVQVTLDLADGSRLIGNLKMTDLAVRADFGKVSIPLSSISRIKLSSTRESVVVEMRNSDQLTGFLELPALPVSTLLGNVTVPLEHVREMRFALPAPAEPGENNRTAPVIKSPCPRPHWSIAA